MLDLGNEFLYENIISFGYYNEFLNLKLLNKHWKDVLDHPFFKSEDKQRLDERKGMLATFIYHYYRNGLYKIVSVGVSDVDYYTGPEKTGYCIFYNNVRGVETIFKNGKYDVYKKVYDHKRRLVLSSGRKDGVYHGECQLYYTNGAIKSSTTYEEGQEIGPASLYDPDGNIIRIKTFDGKRRRL